MSLLRVDTWAVSRALAPCAPDTVFRVETDRGVPPIDESGGKTVSGATPGVPKFEPRGGSTQSAFAPHTRYLEYEYLRQASGRPEAHYTADTAAGQLHVPAVGLATAALSSAALSSEPSPCSSATVLVVGASDARPCGLAGSSSTVKRCCCCAHTCWRCCSSGQQLQREAIAASRAGHDAAGPRAEHQQQRTRQRGRGTRASADEGDGAQGC